MPHPLFDTDHEVLSINVTRFEGGGQVWHPHRFEPDELQSLEDVFSVCGGGSYELVAHGRLDGGKGKVKHGIVDRKRYKLPGPSIPFPGNEPPAAVAPAVAVPVLGGDSNLIMGMMQNMMQMFMTTQQKSDERMMGLLTLFVQNGGAGQAEAFKALAQIATANATRPPETPSALGFEKALELGHRLGQAEAAADATGSEAEDDIETFLGGAARAVELFGRNGSPGNSSNKPN